MAKKRRNTKKKHSETYDSNSSEFLADVPETSSDEWDHEHHDHTEDESFQAHDSQNENGEYGDDGNFEADHSVVDPYAEHLNHHDEEPYHSQEHASSQEELSEDFESTFQSNEEGPQSFGLGNFLRDQREQQGISLKSVSQSTKISLTNLEYLEADDLASLPDRAYVMGYVKSYAKLLGIDSHLCIELLDKTYNSQGASAKEPEIVIPQAQNSPKISQGFPAAKIAAVAAMIIVIVGIVGFFMTRDKTPAPKVAVQEETGVEAEEQEITPQTLNAETPLQEEMAQQDEEPLDTDLEESAQNNEEEEQAVTTVTQESKPSTVNEPKETPTQKKEEKQKEEQKEVVTVTEEKEEKKEAPSADNKEEEEEEKRKFYPLTNQLYSVDESFPKEKIDELLTSQFRVSPIEGVQAIFITAVNGDSWLTYKSDNDPIKKFVLKEGRSLLFRAKEARVFLGNLGAVKIFLNNQPLKVTSRTGVKSLVFPQENASNYVIPLFIYKEDGSVQTSEDWIKENE